MAGVGFFGGGAILKQDRDVYGTATAASVWVTAMGAGIGFGRDDVALVIAILNFIILQLLKFFEIDPDDASEEGSG